MYNNKIIKPKIVLLLNTFIRKTTQKIINFIRKYLYCNNNNE